MKKTIRILCLLVFIFCFSSCADDGGVSSTIYFGLLDKVKDFLAFCSLIFDSPRYFHGQFISPYLLCLLYIGKNHGNE